MANENTVLTIMSGGGELFNSPINQTDFKPIPMTVRRSQVLETIKPGQSRMKSELPKSLEREGRFNSEQAR